jgi:1-acyl-sn-glycerol-3-phosphate acyltransferase
LALSARWHALDEAGDMAHQIRARILIFPEGELTKHGRIIPFLAGTGLLAKNLNVSVVPVRIEGLFEIKQRKQYFVRPGKVVVKFGKPLTFDKIATPAEITREIEARVASL